MQSLDCKDGLYILAIMRVQIAMTERLIWWDIDTAFENRTLIGAMINADYIKPWQFLEDSDFVQNVIEQDVIDRHNGIKVNTIFNGEFVAGDKRATKSINMRNYELFHRICVSGMSVTSSNPR